VKGRRPGSQSSTSLRKLALLRNLEVGHGPRESSRIDLAYLLLFLRASYNGEPRLEEHPVAGHPTTVGVTHGASLASVPVS
jgi:hypothetical protein